MRNKRFYYYVPFTRIIGKHKIPDFVVIAVHTHEMEYIHEHVRHYFIYLNGSIKDSEGNTRPNSNHDGCVYLYDGGEMAIEVGIWRLIQEPEANTLALYHNSIITESTIERMKKIVLEENHAEL
jgi:hypothetical protein